MKWRIVQTVDKRFIKGTTSDWGIGPMKTVAASLKIPLWDWAIPEDLGLHWSEKPAVTVRELPAEGGVPLSIPNLPTKEELVAAQIATRNHRSATEDAMGEAEAQLRKLWNRSRLTGCLDMDRLTKLQERYNKSAEACLTAHAEVLKGEERFGKHVHDEATVYTRPEPRNAKQAREAALLVAQFPGLWDTLELHEEHRGRALYTHGKEAFDYLTELASLIKGEAPESVEALREWAEEVAAMGPPC